MHHRRDIRLCALTGILLLLAFISGCGGDDPKPNPVNTLIDPTGVWSLTHATNAGARATARRGRWSGWRVPVLESSMWTFPGWGD